MWVDDVTGGTGSERQLSGKISFLGYSHNELPTQFHPGEGSSTTQLEREQPDTVTHTYTSGHREPAVQASEWAPNS